MIYVFDLDGTLCETTGRDYQNARPLLERIARVNALSADGHTIVIDTARGSGTGDDWGLLTARQLSRWGVQYDSLYVGRKPPGDYYIDDKGVTAEDFFA